ncbi:MAG: alanine--tRNA ligase [Candidatus Taylorbacteria bacterium]|nr:alanine--tRNA ligase [Candidatus Taylorbacteria bacterium]
MKSSEIRSRFLQFFKNRKHTIIESASLITSDEKGVTNPTLFNTAGMQPLIPYLLGKPYIQNGHEVTRLADVQKCLRTVDIDEIGDRTHATFFEMLGNWSLGDYFKEEAIKWSYEFLTSKEEGLGLDSNRLYVTVFEGDAVAAKDVEAAEIWKRIFKANRVNDGEGDTSKSEKGRIFFMPASSNWWEAGENGPCGPDTEMYYDIGNTFNGKGITHERFLETDSKREVVEVWNDVFMQYEKKDGKIVGKLPKPSVDTGAGLERLAMVMQAVDNIFDTDLLKPEMETVKVFSKNWKIESARIVADHIRAAVFLITDGVIPSNTDRGYVLRKLIRRAVRHGQLLKMSDDGSSKLDAIVNAVVLTYENVYNEVAIKKDFVIAEILKEEARFKETLNQGLKEFEKGVDAFTLFSSYGFPLELTLELAKEKGIVIDVNDFNKKFKKHQELSRAGAEQKFKGGLADSNNEMVVRYHTATHLLHQALFDVLGNGVMQKGSNITTERLRFDFAHGAKMTDDDKKKVETIVNEKINAVLPVIQVKMSKEEAEKTGAKHFFGEKYGDEISIYYVGDSLEKAYSKEFCGGPHVKNTRELAGPEGKWHFKILKEEAVARGVRRIKAVLK